MAIIDPKTFGATDTAVLAERIRALEARVEELSRRPPASWGTDAPVAGSQNGMLHCQAITNPRLWFRVENTWYYVAVGGGTGTGSGGSGEVPSSF